MFEPFVVIMDRDREHLLGVILIFGSEQVAGFRLECMAGFIGIRWIRSGEALMMAIKPSLTAIGQRARFSKTGVLFNAVFSLGTC